MPPTPAAPGTPPVAPPTAPAPGTPPVVPPAAPATAVPPAATEGKVVLPASVFQSMVSGGGFQMSPPAAPAPGTPPVVPPAAPAPGTPPTEPPAAPGEPTDHTKHPEFIAMQSNNTQLSGVLSSVLDQIEASLPANLKKLVTSQSTTGEGDTAVVDQVVRANAINMALATMGGGGGGVNTGRSGTSGAPGTPSTGAGDDNAEKRGPTTIAEASALASKRMKELSAP